MATLVFITDNTEKITVSFTVNKTKQKVEI